MNYANFLAKFRILVATVLKQFQLASVIRSKSYSQFWEDRLIKRIILGNAGSYVDIGSGTPIWGSNTYIFYKDNWRGVTVDPIRLNIALHRLLRPHDTQYCALVTNTSQTLEFYELDPWELSTLNEELAIDRLAAGAKLIQKQVCETIKLKEIYEKHQMPRPNLLSIDVEGMELDVLESNDWTLFKPDLIVVEELINPILGSDIQSYLLKLDYRLSAYNGVSSIYTLNGSAFITA